MGAPRGFDDLLRYPLVDAVFHRRTRRVSRGVRRVRAGSLSYEDPDAQPRPLSELEEAILIAMTGTTGITLPDRPFESDDGTDPIMGAPNMTMAGRSAGSPDNAQATHFFLINDAGTYYLRRLEKESAPVPFTPENLVARARASKQLILDERLDFPDRDFPAYLDSNRFLSNLPGTTILLPVVDLTRQYINALMYLLTQPDGSRPALVDDRNFYLPAGTRRWIRSGFLNKDITLPLGSLGTMRTDYEAMSLLQTLMLTAQAMGLGAWIHATIGPPVMLGHPRFAPRYGRGLGFDYAVPRFNPLDQVRWGVALPEARAHPVGLPGAFTGLCPPYVEDMGEAVDRIIEHKFGPDGVYRDPDNFRPVFREGLAERYMAEVPVYEPEVIECTKAICRYIHRTHGRFPAHCDAVHVPGVWLQVHSLNLGYYDALFDQVLTPAQRTHDERWPADDSD
ncbi:MAG: hypothetical protein R2737_12445 [Candidatus Nanopelagicales bacterium]